MTNSNEQDRREGQADESQYVGNIWGWKFSWISLGIILFFMLLMGLRYQYLKATGQWESAKQKIESPTEQ